MSLFQNNRVSLIFTVLSVQFQKKCTAVHINQALLLHNVFKISIDFLQLLFLKWSVHDTCIPSPSHLQKLISLFPVIDFELPKTRTFFDFP